MKRNNADKKQYGLILENTVCNKVVRMTGELFHGGEDMVGTMTSGNYKSINQATQGRIQVLIWGRGGGLKIL